MLETYAALFRAVNLAGRNKLSMTDLRRLLTDVGVTDARTLLQSGNAVFRSASRSPGELERLLETEAEKRLGLRTDVFVRDGAELDAVIKGNPFADEARRDPGHLVVLFLKRAPAASNVKALQAAIKDREIVRAHGRHAYIVYPDGIGRSRLTGALIGKYIEGPGTSRNWNTVLKLATNVGGGASPKR